MPTQRFADAVVVVTGAASGIGRELALQAGAQGAMVIGADINFSELEKVRAEAWKKDSLMAIHKLDVADKEAVFRFSQAVIPQFRNLRLILINNAGIGLFSGSFAHTDLDDFEQLLRINLYGTIYMTKAFYPYLLERNAGHLVNLSSVFGLGGIANQSAYCTSKFAIRGFTETLRMELRESGIGTTVVHPGGINTNIVKAALPKGPVATEAMHRNSVKSFARAAKTSPAKAARLILDAVEQKKERLVIGSDGKTIDLLTRLFPVGYTSVLQKRIRQIFSDPYKKK